jgi:hypothetical protein
MALSTFHFSVHDDVQLCQWLRKKDGKLKLGDFNRADIMTFNEEEGEYCKYNNGQGFGNVSLSRSATQFGTSDFSSLTSLCVAVSSA